MHCMMQIHALVIGSQTSMLIWALSYIQLNWVEPFTLLSMLFQHIAECLENASDLGCRSLNPYKSSVFKGMAAELQGFDFDTSMHNAEVLPSTSMDISDDTTVVAPWDTAPESAHLSEHSVISGHSDVSMEDDSCGSDSINSLRRSRFDEKYFYKELRTLGQGGNGKCILLERQPNKELRVCKLTRGIQRINCNQVAREVRTLRDVLPANGRVLRFYDAVQSIRQCQIYTEYCDGGDLGDLINHYLWYRITIPESFIWHCFLQLAEGLAFIHHGYDYTRGSDQKLPKRWQQVIHADLKPENVFLRLSRKPNGYPDLVLGDFGASQLAPGTGHIGTYQWCPPEIPDYSAKGDVWTMGAIIHALCHRGLPPIGFLPKHVPYTRQNYLSWCCTPQARQIKPLTEYSLELEDCMREAMKWKIEYRYSSYEILQSIWYEISMGVASSDIWEPLRPGWEERWWKGRQ